MEKTSSRTSISVLIVICLTAFSLMLYASLTDSGTMDELAHIPAGYGYVRYLDFRLNPEHPPLVKALAGIPLLFQNLHFPTDSKAWTEDVNGQWDQGAQFLYFSGNDANAIIHWARLGPMLLTILLIVFVYFWSRELLGKWWALFPTFLFGLSPSVLAHGHYVTTDIGAAFGILFATYFFLKHLFSPSRKHLWYAGLAFGVAQSLKFSAVLLIPYFICLIFVFYVAKVIRNWNDVSGKERFRKFFKQALKYTGTIIAVFAIGYLIVVYPIYALFTVHYPIEKQVSDTVFILGSFAGGPTPAGAQCAPTRCIADLTIWASKHRLTRPMAEYALGVLMVLQRSAGGNTGYFLGQVSAAGWKYYFPVVYTLKETLPTLLMVLIAFLFSLRNIGRKLREGLRHAGKSFLDYLQTNFSEFAMLAFVVFYWIYSIRSPLNIGFRHLFPTLPLIYILTASGFKKWVTAMQFPQGASVARLFFVWIKHIFTASLKYLVLLVLLIWFTLETVFAAPHFLSYFNEVGGGVYGGYRYATDSNYDWGQDLLRLQKFVASHSEIDRIGVDYFGAGNPKYYLGNKEENWWSARGNPANENIHWLAVSVNTLQGAIGTLAPGQGRNPEDEYRWLTELRPPAPGLGNVPEPDYRIGTTIFVYKL